MARDSVHRPVLRWGRGAWLALLLVACAAPAVTAPVRSRPATRPAHRPAPRTVDAASLPDRPPADPDAIWHVRDLRPGMKGYGFTVFKGDKVERFGVTIIGVLPKMYMGQDMVLIRLDGGPITGRNAFLIHGMSGSPIYVDGKLVGAFSMAASNYWAKEPIGAVTPIEAMLEALDPKLDPEPVGITSAEMTLPNPIPTSAGAMRDIFMGPESLAPPDAPGRLTLRPLATPVMVSGLGSRAFKQLASFLENWNLLAQPAPGQAPANLKPKLEVGGSLGVNLMTGDIDISGIGTVTWMKGDRVLGWGHPFFQLGGAQFGISNAWVYDIFPGVQASNKIAAAGEVIGTLDHDRPFCVSGRVGPRPTMIPITCNVEDRSTGRKKTFRAEAVNHPQLMGQMATIAVGEAIFETRPVPGDITANVRLSIDTEGLGHIERRNMVYDQFQIDSAATLELAQMLQLLSSNDLKRVPVKALNVDVTLEKKQPTATVERIFIKQERYEPGETVDVGVVLRLYRGETTVLHTNVKIPEGAQGGRAVLMVNGGATRVNLAALTGGSTGIVPLPGATPAAATVSQLVKQFLERERNDQIVTHLLFSSSAVNINGEKLSRLPGPIADVMRSSRTTGLRVEQDEVKSASDTEFVVQGVQRLFITIQRKDSSETGTGASSEGSGAPGASPGSPGTARNLLVPDDEAVLSDARRFASPEEDEAPAASPPSAGNGAAEAPKKPSEAKKKSARAEQKPGEAEKKPEPESPPVDDQLLGKAATWWTQTSFADFQRGTNQGTGATLRGEVRLAPSLKLLYESGEQFIWSVVALRGEYYTGTGNSGLVLCVGRDGKSSEFFRTGELEVHALAKDGAGNLYAGTSPHGRVYRIDPSGKGTLLMELSRACSETNPNGPTEPARYVLCLAVAADGSVYAGTGPEGRIYRIATDGKASLFFQTPESNVLSLLPGEKGSLYAGTGESGLVFHIDAQGHGRVLYDSDQNAITALARDAQGNLYVATSPKGTITRIAPAGTARTYLDDARGGITALALGSDGMLFAGAANNIYCVEPGGDTLLLSDAKRAQFMALDRTDDGRLVAASANVGSLYAVDPGTTGTFESAVHDAKRPARWGRLRWSGNLPQGATAIIQTRSGNTPEPDATWSAWQPPLVQGDGAYVASPPARYLQYRVEFRAGDTHARVPPVSLRDIRIAYKPQNQPPTLSLTSPAGGEIWRGTQEIKWSGSDPDKDALAYEVFFSDDGAKTWHPLGKRLAQGVGPAPAGPSPRPSLAQAEEALRRYRALLEAQADLTPQQREDALHRAAAMVERYRQENPEKDQPPKGGAGEAPKPEPKSADEKPKPETPGGPTKDTSLKWDTTSVPDGIYLIKVVASDRIANPGEPLSEEKVSEPVIVTNTKPETFIFASGAQTDAERRVSVQGFAQARVSIKGAQFRVDTGDWQALDPEDGIWDGSLEPWRLTYGPLSPGAHVLEVKVVDVAGNVSVTQAKITVQ